MSEREDVKHIQQLISINERRFNRLHLKKTYQGISADVSLDMEMDDIIETLEKLETLLERLTGCKREILVTIRDRKYRRPIKNLETITIIKHFCAATLGISEDNLDVEVLGRYGEAEISKPVEEESVEEAVEELELGEDEGEGEIISQASFADPWLFNILLLPVSIPISLLRRRNLKKAEQQLQEARSLIAEGLGVELADIEISFV